MSGITLDDIANDETMETLPVIEAPGEYDQEIVNDNRRAELLKKLLTTETGPGPLTDYIDHPMNFNKSNGLAKILRGISGFLGGNSLRLAVLDIVMGVLEFSKEKGTNGISSGDISNY